jgi:hypothetical protein
MQSSSAIIQYPANHTTKSEKMTARGTRYEERQKQGEKAKNANIEDNRKTPCAFRPKLLYCGKAHVK